MEQIQNNRVITDLYRENAQFPGIALDGSDVYLCWQRFVDRHDSLTLSAMNIRFPLISSASVYFHMIIIYFSIPNLSIIYLTG